MSKGSIPSTPAIRLLRQQGIAFTPHSYRYQERGGTEISARELGVDEHAVIKTLIMETEDKSPLIVLMHGDRKVSTRNLARQIGCKQVVPCEPKVADRHTGYQVGGTSPFGTRRAMPVYMEKTILDLETVYINGGRRGLLVGLSPRDIQSVLNPILVEVAQ